jgi:hypothetical protein
MTTEKDMTTPDTDEVHDSPELHSVPPADDSAAEAVEAVPPHIHSLRERLRAMEKRAIHVPVVGKLHAPDTHDVVYLAGMTALIAFGAVELPIALAVLGGHLLVKQHHSRSLSAIGECVEDVFVH